MAIKLRLESKGIKNELSDINRLIEKMEGQHTLNIAGQAKLEALNKVAKELNKELVKMYEDKATRSNPYLRTQQNLEKLKRTTQEYIQLKKKESDGTITKTEVAQLKEKEKIIRICNQQIGKYGTESQKAYRNEINSSKKVQLSIQNEIKAIKQKAEAQQQAARQEEANQKKIAQLKKDYEKSVNTEKSYVKKQEKSDHYNKAGVKQTNSEEFNTNEALKVERDLQAQILQQLRERGVAEDEINELIRTRNNQIGYQQKTVSQKAQYEDAIKLTKEQYEIEKRLINLKADPKQTKFHQEEIAALEKELEATKKLKEEKLAANENGTELTQDQKKYQQELESSLQRSNELYKAQRKDIVNAKNATSELGDTIKKVFNYVLVYKGFQLLSQGIQQAVNTMKELDKAFTDIQMVTGDSDEATAELAQEYNTLAKQMGSTTKEVAEGASEWLRQGKTASETTELLKASMTLSKVGAIESSQATELLTSSLNGYKVAAEDAMSIVDKISAIDLEAATSSEELAVALARTANSANDAGVSFDKLLAMIGTTSSVTRKSASTIGESFKTIFARMSNVAAGKDTDDEGESLNDVEKTLTKLDIKLRDSVGQWRSFEEVLDEVAEKWNNGVFNDVEKSQVATAIAGVRQQENFRALMNNWTEVQRLTGVAANSTGSASQKMGTYLDSVEAKTNQLKATWEEFIMSLNQSDSYKAFLDLCIFIIEHLSEIIVLVTAFIAVWKLDTINTKISGLSKLLKSFKGDLFLVKEAFLGARVSGESFSTTLVGLAGKEKAAAMSTKLLKVELLALVAVIMTVYEWQQKSIKAAIEKNNKTAEEITNINDQRQSLTELMEAYKETYNSTDKFSDKKSKLQEIEKQLIDLYKDEADGVNLVSGSYEEQIEVLKELEKQSIHQQASKLRENKGNSEKVVSQAAGRSQDENVFEWLGNNMTSGATDRAASSLVTVAKNYLHQLKGEDIVEMQMNTNQKDLLDTYYQLQKYLDENKDLSEDVIKNIQKYQQDIMDYVSEEAKVGYEQLKDIEYYDYIDNNSDAYLNYKEFLEKKQGLLKKYNEAETKEEEEKYAKQMQNLDKQIDEAKQKLYNGASDIVKTQLDEEFLPIQIDTNKYLSPSNWLQSNNNLSDDEKKQIQELEEEIKTTGKLSDESRIKLAALKEELYKKENGDSFVEQLNKDLGGIGNQSKINLDKNNLRNEYNKTQKDTEINSKNKEIEEESIGVYEAGSDGADYYLEKNGGNPIDAIEQLDSFPERMEQKMQEVDKLIQEEKDNVDRWLTGVNASLEDLGLNTSAKWYQDLSEGLRNGQIDFDTFYDTVSEKCKLLGIDLEDLTKKMEETESTPTILGSQEDFIGEVDKIDQLYEDAATIKSGKTLDNDRIVELRNEYEDLNKYIAETGDLTLKNGQLLTEIAGTTYDDGQKALEGQISALEDYQDAILNTVDAMGIMAEFKEELAKIDSELAGTITDNAIAEAEAKGLYTDISQASADGVYEANESVIMSEDALYNATQANVQGILDAKETQADLEQGIGEAEIAVNDAIQASGAETADQKIASAQWVGDAKTTEAEITAGAAETESIAEGSSAQASATGAESKADSQSIAAQAAITTGQAFLEMAQAIAQAEGVETSSLSDASAKLSDLQGKLDTLNADNASNAQKAAAAYKEAQAKIQEAKARLNSYKSANKTGRSNYNAAKSSGSGSGSGYSSQDAAKDLADILEDIKDYEADIELDLEDQTEQLINHYNLEKNKLESLKEELDYYEGIYDSVENTTKWLETQQKLLENQSKAVEALQKSNDKIEKQREKIYKENSKYKVSGWFDSEGNETLAYGDLINSFEYKRNQIQKDAAKEMRKVYNSVSKSKSEKAIENAKEKIEEIEKEADKKIEALEKEQEKVENIYNSVSELNDAWEENQEAIRDALADMHDRIIDIRDTLVDQMMEQLEKAVDKQNESIEKDVTRMEQLVSIREKYYDILNETIDTQQELDSELQSSLDSFEYLDEQMRQLMFNEEDYKVLSETLTGIQDDIANIWEDHYNKIDSLTDDEMYKAEYITAETERQLEMKMQEYELAKAELDVAKARTNLQNVQNERNVRMFVNGQWQWVLFKLTHLVINGKYKHGELLETREVISTKTEYLKWYKRIMSKNDIIYGNQQPSPKGKVHRLSERSRT